MNADDFAARLLDWWRTSGRKDLPWQRDVSPYRVWVSEIMLQQTQVATVVPYFERFVARFPDVAALAAAPLDEVLHLWSGLGYYARARHLHAAAGVVCARFHGELPEDIESLTSLPGIGRSTAGAILALSRGRRAAILDGNVKRVLARCFAVDGYPGETATARRLWALSESLAPVADTVAYTQALMDLGATVCTRRRPDCSRCPFEGWCVAHLAGREADFPTPRPRRSRPLRAACMIVAVDERGAVLLERRPAQGLWGGLWGLPEIEIGGDAAAWCPAELGCAAQSVEEWPVFRHGFTHFELDIKPVLVRVGAVPPRVSDAGRRFWYRAAEPARLGLAAPVKTLLARLEATS
ncbi:MAG TPA: A/G-specific adenine glycosylase [Gammaproteobacteria bacterium]|nr:A/G-specific adenine glycosylase [Gammaproteobacteria bacterium]